jgi:hypothetical protein
MTKPPVRWIWPTTSRRPSRWLCLWWKEGKVARFDPGREQILLSEALKGQFSAELKCRPPSSCGKGIFLLVKPPDSKIFTKISLVILPILPVFRVQYRTGPSRRAGIVRYVDPDRSNESRPRERMQDWQIANSDRRSGQTDPAGLRPSWACATNELIPYCAPSSPR